MSEVIKRPEIIKDDCRGCVYATPTKCESPNDTDTDCTYTVWVEDTPEAQAAYIAAKTRYRLIGEDE